MSKHLFEGYEAGYYDLPADLVETKQAYDRLLAHEIPAPELTQDGDTVDLVLKAARNGGQIPTRIDLTDNDTSQAAYQNALRALQTAKTIQKQALRAMTQGNAVVLISDYLRPAYEQVLEQAKSHAHILEGADISAMGIARADAKTQKSLLAAGALVARYEGLRSAWWMLFQFKPMEYAAYAPAWGEVRNAFEVWPRLKDLSAAALAGNDDPYALFAGAAPPWPRADFTARMLWMATHPEAGPWMPTPDEFDERVAEQKQVAISGWRVRSDSGAR